MGGGGVSLYAVAYHGYWIPRKFFNFSPVIKRSVVGISGTAEGSGGKWEGRKRIGWEVEEREKENKSVGR